MDAVCRFIIIYYSGNDGNVYTNYFYENNIILVRYTTINTI